MVKILIVDDSITNLLILKKILSEDYEVDLASSGREALNMLEKDDYCLVLLDISMPDMDGYEVCSILKNNPKTKDIPVIFVTSSSDPEDEINAFKYGAVDFVTKPYNNTVIKARVSTHVKLYLNKLEIEKTNWELKRYITFVDENVLISFTDLDGNITYASKAFCDFTGYSQSELLHNNHRILKHPENSMEIYKTMWNALTNDNIWSGEIKNVKKDGSVFWVKTKIAPMFDSKGVKIGYSAVRQDITDKKIIEDLVVKDPLTGLYNRRYFNEFLPKLLNKYKRDNKPVVLSILDVDYFKLYNDTYGHLKGDDVLKSVAKAISENMKRGSDFAFRIGGEEFCIVFETDSPEKSRSFANMIRESVENLNIEHSLSKHRVVTISMGVVHCISNDFKDIHNLYKYADKLLYDAKESGRNKIVMEVVE